MSLGIVASSYQSDSGGGGGAATFTYRTHDTDISNSSSYTFSSQSIGAADSNREVVVALMMRASGTVTVSSVTIGGVSATQDATASNLVSSNTTLVAFYRAAVPTGTTADVVVNLSAGAVRCFIGVWTTDASVSVDGTDSSQAEDDTVTCTSSTGGTLLWAAYNDDTANYSFSTGATQRFTTGVLESVEGYGADQASSGASTDITWTASKSVPELQVLAVAYS